MLRPGFVVALVAALALAGLGMALTATSRARAERSGPTAADAPPRSLRSLSEVPGAASRTSEPAAPAEPRRTGPAPAQVLRVRDGRTVILRDRPRGREIARVGARTEFGSSTALSVARRRGRWAGVPHPVLGNGRLGWVDVRGDALGRRTTDVRVSVSLSRRRLELRVRGKLVRHVTVAIGRPGSTTPRGRFSITDKLSGSRYGPYYGCCILALSGTQPNTPPGWTGGNRLAIHGTNSPSTIGTPSSAGCLRASDEDLRMLMRRVPLGTPVVVRK